MAPSPTIRRLLKECAELSPASSNPNPTFYAAPVSETDLHEWHFTLLGPPSPSPYAGGLYHGRITLPPAYPMKPPNFRFLTPSGRFEVNREICLSISGFHEETWQPAWGVRTALVALRGFMNEEGGEGQVGGVVATADIRKTLAKQSRTWRCSVCGDQDAEDGSGRGTTNEERMEWWWEVCRSRGVKIDQNSGEGVAVEKLPDGMKVEAREKKAEGTQSEAVATIEDPSPSLQSTPLPTTTNYSAAVEDPTISESLSELQPTSRVPQSEQQARPRTASSEPSVVPRPPALPLHAQAIRARAQAERTITIDRAITAIFIALVIMILKKVFYPGANFSFGSGHDDLRMLRE